ncbi:predicted protein [Histoplasma capsulatum G186AR]|uniref:Uncharacterized protein n=1 Tax=Ajellomyces capsulatus (strain G186AR / H82 / ATCC MYA-2454 / RMSCC 2432) TaxID=447093 RepID=C0NL81_AJECG|nr:uncharacterized protein HCBG_03911 [Histoplasma capsulatum G186AR]EEH08622.1 predicted protein [Histoplasma capsulatum G186AR]
MSNASSATPARHCIAKRAFGSRKLCRQSPATAEYIYVALALDAAVGLLSSRAAKDAMARITRLFDEYLPSHLQLFRDISDAGIARSIDSTPWQVIPPIWRGQVFTIPYPTHGPVVRYGRPVPKTTGGIFVAIERNETKRNETKRSEDIATVDCLDLTLQSHMIIPLCIGGGRSSSSSSSNSREEV